ncbi:MAG TPA: hypothetical protein VKT21_03780, partial [Thermoplasmata archaeon]|nr:hypothetical protein [Thermoplasmata archaeon]
VLIEEHGRVAFSVWTDTVWILIAVYGGYLLLRILARWRASVHARREGFSSIEPTSNPWVWLLADEEDTPDHYRLRYQTLRLGQGDSQGPRSMTVAKAAPSTGPVDSPQAALDRTYVAAMNKNRWLRTRYHFGEAMARGNAFHVVWYAVGMGGTGRAIGVQGEIDRTTGAMQLKSGLFRRPPAEQG